MCVLKMTAFLHTRLRAEMHIGRTEGFYKNSDTIIIQKRRAAF
jgi:hypothetical protein